MSGHSGEETTDLLIIVSKDLISDGGEETTSLWTIISKDLIGNECALTKGMIVSVLRRVTTRLVRSKDRGGELRG